MPMPLASASADHSAPDVLDFWFPDTGHQTTAEAHAAFWTERMQGGMDAAIIARFAVPTLSAATGLLDHWADTPHGRLALLIALDQFSRSRWRGTPAAYSQDIKATRLALEGIANGDIDALEPWEATFFVIAIGHCEGPDHLDRMLRLDPVIDRIIAQLPPHLAPSGPQMRSQIARVTEVIRTYGRHPHRNAILGRPSTPDEARYIAKGAFPHLPDKEQAP